MRRGVISEEPAWPPLGNKYNQLCGFLKLSPRRVYPKERRRFTPQLLYLIGKSFEPWYIYSLKLPGCTCVGIRWVPEVLTPQSPRGRPRVGGERHPA